MASSSLFSHPSPSSETSPFSFLPTSPTTLFLTTSAIVLGSWLYIWHLQPWVKLKEMSPKEKISDKLYNLCHSPDSISSEYAKDPSSTPSKISSHLYHQHIDAVHQSQPPKERVPARASSPSPSFSDAQKHQKAQPPSHLKNEKCLSLFSNSKIPPAPLTLSTAPQIPLAQANLPGSFPIHPSTWFPCSSFHIPSSPARP